MSTDTSTATAAEIDFPNKGLIDPDEYGLYMTRRPSVTVAVQRDVVDPIMIRNTANDRAETQTLAGVRRAQANPEKFVSKERLTGLDLLRALDDGDDLISDAYRYNEPPGLSDAINMDSLTYGLAGTGEQDFGIKSRVTVGYTYSLEEYETHEGEVRNKVYESGTMTDDEGEHSQGLFEEARVQPGNAFVHFLTVEAGTPAMLAYALHNVLNTSGYGARETRSGKTIENTVRALVVSDFPVRLSTGEFVTEYDPEDTDHETVGDALAGYLTEVRRADWDVYGDENAAELADFPDWFEDLRAVAGRERADATEVLHDLLAADQRAASSELLDGNN